MIWYFFGSYFSHMFGGIDRTRQNIVHLWKNQTTTVAVFRMKRYLPVAKPSSVNQMKKIKLKFGILISTRLLAGAINY